MVNPMTTTREEQRDAFATLNYRSVAKWERKQGREELARVIESAADEIDHLRSASQAGGVPAGWMDISTAPKDDTLFLAACPPDERFPSGRIMIWCGTILAAQNDRTPGHLRFPAKWWMPLPALPVSGGAHAE